MVLHVGDSLQLALDPLTTSREQALKVLGTLEGCRLRRIARTRYAIDGDDPYVAKREPVKLKLEIGASVRWEEKA